MYLSGVAKHKSMWYLDYVCSLLFFSYVLLNMTIGLSITFHLYGTSLVEEQGPFHRNHGFSRTRVTLNIFTAVIAL